MNWLKRLDLQTKVIIILVFVILPTFMVVTWVENQVASPILLDELKNVGVTSAKTLATEISSHQLFGKNDSEAQIADAISEIVYLQPNILSVHVFKVEAPSPGAKEPAKENYKHMASYGSTDDLAELTAKLHPISQIEVDQEPNEDPPIFNIRAPIKSKSGRVTGVIVLSIATTAVEDILNAFSRITVGGAALSVIVLILALSYFLRIAISNERLLRQTQTANLQLSEQLHEAERRLLTSEKLAVMGQLTASFAHEIGTPLNSIGGHMQLLAEEVKSDRGAAQSSIGDRIQIINGQISKIAQIVRDFLDSTAKPKSQRQLVDLNEVVQRTVALVRPRTEALRIDTQVHPTLALGPLRAVPVEIEQIMLNLLNNSIDSLKAKRTRAPTMPQMSLKILTGKKHDQGREFAEVIVYDTGMGIRSEDLRNVLKPFFTTKQKGEGTGLGLTICQELVKKYGGGLEVESREGKWTRVTVRIPYAEGYGEKA
ncbi:MAG: sensor histidine kinase [Bacteriovoracia bacterium]